MSNYDGWAIKYHWGHVSAVSFRVYRSQVIQYYEDRVKGLWKKNRQKGYVKLVKVRLIEVED